MTIALFFAVAIAAAIMFTVWAVVAIGARADADMEFDEEACIDRASRRLREVRDGRERTHTPR